MKTSRVSVAARVVAAARRIKQEQGNVQDLPATRLERGTADDRPTLTAIFPMKGGGEPHRLDLSLLLDFPSLTETFAEGLLQWFKSMDPKSRITSLSALRSCWFAYLSERSLCDIELEMLDEQVMAGFNAWLHQKRQKNGSPLSPNTIRKALGALRNVLDHAPDAAAWSDRVPTGPRGASRRAVPTEVLPLDALLQVIAAAEKEVLDLRDRWEDGQRLLKHGHTLLELGAKLEGNPASRAKRRNPQSRPDSNLALALAMLDKRYPGVIPDIVATKAHDAKLAATVQYGVGQTTVTSYLYANSRDLVPLVLCLAVATIFNPDTVLGLKWESIDRTIDRLGHGAVRFDVREHDEEKVEMAEDIESDELSDSPLVQITGDKPRATRRLVRLLDPEASGPAQVSLDLVLDLLSALTARIRPHVVEPLYRDFVFLFVQNVGTKRAKGFGTSTKGPSNDAAWMRALSRFIAENNLPDFTLKTLRATLLDFVQLFNRGDLEAAQQVGNHGTRLTTWTHYTSDLVKRLLQEATGETLLVRERWLDSAGKLDPRQHRESTSKGCATPGWMCMDPFDSPRPNQRQGRLCTAYGECPDCPLAAARPSNPFNVMLYEALRRAIYRSIARVTASVWQQRWAPVLVALDALLKDVQPAVIERSRSLRIELPDVG